MMRDNILPVYTKATGGEFYADYRTKGIEESFPKLTAECAHAVHGLVQLSRADDRRQVPQGGSEGAEAEFAGNRQAGLLSVGGRCKSAAGPGRRNGEPTVIVETWLGGNALPALLSAGFWGVCDFSAGMGVKSAGGGFRSALRVVVLSHCTSLFVLLILVRGDSFPHGTHAGLGSAGRDRRRTRFDSLLHRIVTWRDGGFGGNQRRDGRRHPSRSSGFRRGYSGMAQGPWICGGRDGHLDHCSR